ncbi:unnamed protein product [Rhizoctonia solani]|uniref:Uncharacterized protein n=1 Tax=Rhizoctonia solani TaxID=456999 RepID=A0A8H2X0U9_9AGAM|nr:unnamed protein product [Rhizoctonia solani]
MQSGGNLRQPNGIYGATPQRHHPYSQSSPTQNTPSEFGQPTFSEKPVDKDSCCLNYSNERSLGGVLYHGSASLNCPPPTRTNQDLYGKHSYFMITEGHRNNRSFTQGLWGLSAAPTLVPMSAPSTHSSSQSSSPSIPNREPNTSAGIRAKPSLKRQQGSSKRPSPDEFQNLVLFPRDHESILLEYVGTDSKYTLAKNHAGMIVRSSIKSQDITSRMHEVAEPLDAIDIFLGILLEHQALKLEQKGCLSLRICFGALTALLGDFSQGGGVENFVSDPHAAVVPREQLAQFRDYNPNLKVLLRRLSEKLEKSMNLYRHRRSPSGSLVAKFQEMSDTLNVWSQYLGDNTFASPSRIASDWLRNHPTQVDSRRRNQAYSEQASPILSDATRSSPPQVDANYLSPMNAFSEPPRLPNNGNMRPTSTDAPIQHENLFRSGVTFYGPQVASTGSIPFNHGLYPTMGGLNENINMPSLPGGLGILGHQSHSPNAAQYHANNSGFY